jgi:dihydroxyacetone kinase-like protein
MQRFVNNPDEVVEDTVKGFVKAHRDIVRQAENPRVVAAVGTPHKGKVGVVTGGGSGHEPAFIGYTGKNMLDAVAVGELFSSPTAKSFHDAIKEADGGRGVAVLYGNYAGDNMNVKMATKLAAKDGIEWRRLLPMMTHVQQVRTNERNAAGSQAKSSCGRSAEPRPRKAPA